MQGERGRTLAPLPLPYYDYDAKVRRRVFGEDIPYASHRSLGRSMSGFMKQRLGNIKSSLDNKFGNGDHLDGVQSFSGLRRRAPRSRSGLRRRAHRRRY